MFMNHPATESDIIGKTIAKILQTEWEHSEKFSSCNFYIEFTDGTLISLCESFIQIESDGRASLNLQNIDRDSDFPAFWSSDGNTGVGATIEKVLTTSYNTVCLQMSGQYYLAAVLEEGQTALCIWDQNDFLDNARSCEYFDYWTKAPCIFNNMRAIDMIIESSVDDLVLWQSSDLHLTIGRIKDEHVSELLSVPNMPNGEACKARVVVPEPGAYRIIVKRRQGDFVTDVQIDEAVIVGGRLNIRIP
jgi:hypothetical protein